MRENEVCMGYKKPRKRRSSRLDIRSSRLDQGSKLFLNFLKPNPVAWIKIQKLST